MQVQTIPWQGQNPPQEQELRRLMQKSNLSPYSWSNGPNYAYDVHSHGYEKVLYCVEGSIRFILHDSSLATSATESIDLHPGDCMILPPGVRHSALVGPRGVTCLEAASNETAPYTP